MLALGLSALCAFILGFSHKKRGTALFAEAETETSAELLEGLRQKAEKEMRKSRLWFWISGLAAAGAVAFFIMINSI